MHTSLSDVLYPSLNDVIMKITVYWAVKPCSVLDVFRLAVSIIRAHNEGSIFINLNGVITQMSITVIIKLTVY